MINFKSYLLLSQVHLHKLVSLMDHKLPVGIPCVFLFFLFMGRRKSEQFHCSYFSQSRAHTKYLSLKISSLFFDMINLLKRIKASSDYHYTPHTCFFTKDWWLWKGSLWTEWIFCNHLQLSQIWSFIHVLQTSGNISLCFPSELNKFNPYIFTLYWYN